MQRKNGTDNFRTRDSASVWDQFTSEDHGADVCRLRTANRGPISVERIGQTVACEMCAMLRLQSKVGGKVLFERREALLQKRLFQVSLIITYNYYMYDSFY